MASLTALLLASAVTVAPTPKTAITLAERIVEHDAKWAPTSVYCERPAVSATRRRSTCQWVAQGNPLLPDEIVTVTAVYARGGAYRFTLVATTYRPSGRRASCRVEAAARGGYCATCRRV